MDNRRDFLKKATLLASGAGMLQMFPDSIQKALAINPATGSNYLDAEHVVLLMQENRSFDHTYGTLKGVRGFNDPRAIRQHDKKPVWLQTSKEGDTYAPFHLDIKDTKATWMSSLPHSWSNQVDARNEGRHDKWLDAKHSGNDEYSGMPLTMGYYNRQDIPFYYALADAFTICDQNFCSSLTGTTPNRLFFWSGTIREQQKAEVLARVWNGDSDYDNWAGWKTFPERLEENGIPWKVYQNEISVGVGFEGEEDAWLANFTDNPLEFFSQYNVKLSPLYIANLPAAAIRAETEIRKMETELPAATGEKAAKLEKKLKQYKAYLIRNAEEQKFYTLEKYNQLSDHEKALHQKAFATNKNDPHYHSLTTLKYQDGGTEREVEVPKGDVLHQFRDDVKNGNLPAVSWIVAPENFSDHPGAAWYGAWYISEVLDILTKNPEVWKKTIFILAYDENDGYFDHVPPFVAPHPQQEGTGLVSKGIDTGVEYVLNAQQSDAGDARESSIGLGYRVPLVIVSPWSRGGFVCSEVFDHTSSLQFLETFLTRKSGKKIEESNISKWRRTICGDLSSAFRPYNGEVVATPAFLQRDAVVKDIHQAKFKEPPSNYKKLSAAEIEQVIKHEKEIPFMPGQEKGIRAACAIPYELYVEGTLTTDRKKFELKMAAGNKVFGDRAAGAPFTVYAPGLYREQLLTNRNYTVMAGDELKDHWDIASFQEGSYQIEVHGPNGFFREFNGNHQDPAIKILCSYEPLPPVVNRLSGNLLLMLENKSRDSLEIEVTDNAYKSGVRHKILGGISSASSNAHIILDLSKSSGWYDFTVRVRGNQLFAKRYAGHVETGKESQSDPLMGGIL